MPLTELAWILLPPLVAGLLALATHVPLGRQVLRRGIVFIDLAIAQVAGLGVLLAEWWLHGGQTHHGHHHDHPAWQLPLAAALAALAGSAIVAALGRLWPQRQEALIGLLYVGAASAAVLLVSADAHGMEKLSTLLAGDVLWATWDSLPPLALATAVWLALVWALRRWRPAWLASGAGFYAGFGVLVSLSLPLLGLYLVFATLIVPALVAERRTHWPKAWSFAVGAGGYALGLMLSWRLDWPSGPSIVLALIALGTLAMLTAPRRGAAQGAMPHSPG